MNLLIVDDSKLNRTIAAKLIELNNVDVNVVFAETGYEALEKLESESIDIILLDIIMPGIDGVETLKRIRDDERYQFTKVMMFSTISEKSYLQKCFHYGATDFITKPIEEIEFISRLKSTIRQKELEDQMQDNIREIEEQKKQLSEVNMQLIQQEKLAGIGQLAAGVAHEINNPLGFIASNFAVLEEYTDVYIDRFEKLKKIEGLDQFLAYQEQLKDPEYTYIIDDLSELFSETKIGLDRVTEIVKSLRNFSRVDNFDGYEPYNLNNGLKDTLIIVNNMIKYNTHLTVDYGEIPEIEALGNQLNQVLLNIIVNAKDAIVERLGDTMGDIFIKTYIEGDNVVCSIKDNGSGISDDNLNKLFNPFFSTKKIGEGLGLGLSVSYDIIVNKHNGILDVISEVGSGTEFKISLPIKRNIPA